jgi:hypothetical protein
MFFEIELRFWYWRVGKKKQMNTTRMGDRWKANLLGRRDTLYSYHVPRGGTAKLQALHLLLPLAVARMLACLPAVPWSHRTQAG